MTSNKLKVATRTIGKLKKVEKIMKAVESEPAGITPKIMALMTGINQNTIKGLLKDMKGVKNEIRGVYRLVGLGRDSIKTIFEFNFHNITLSCDLKGYTGIRIDTSLSSGLINYRFEIGEVSKQATLHISTEYPINISAIESVYMTFAGLVEKYAGYKPETKDVTVSSIEFNQDYANLKLEGVNCITLENLIEQFKLYQKTNGLRVEHKIKVPIQLETIMDMLTNSSISSDIYDNILSLKKGQDLNLDMLKKVYNLLYAILKKTSPIE